VAEHPAARMRAAAARLRELAAGATAETGDGPWTVVNDTKWVRFPEPRQVPAAPYPFGDGGTELAEGGYEPTGLGFAVCHVKVNDREEEWDEPVVLTRPVPVPVAAYIAAGHPMIMVAVAGWLEDTAVYAERLITPRISACPHWSEERSCDCAKTRAFYCGSCAGYFPIGCSCWGRPLEIARLCLSAEQEK